MATPPPATASASCRRRTLSFRPIAVSRRRWKNWSRPSGDRKQQPLPGLSKQDNARCGVSREMGNQTMNMVSKAAMAAAVLLSLGVNAHAQTTLRIGLAEDPDILDPTL